MSSRLCVCVCMCVCICIYVRANAVYSTPRASCSSITAKGVADCMCVCMCSYMCKCVCFHTYMCRCCLLYTLTSAFYSSWAVKSFQTGREEIWLSGRNEKKQIEKKSREMNQKTKTSGGRMGIREITVVRTSGLWASRAWWRYQKLEHLCEIAG